MAWAIGMAALIVLGGLQISQLADWGMVRPDGLLALAIAWAALAGPRKGLVFGMLSGAVEDVLIGGGIVFTLLRGILCLLAGTVRSVLNVRQSFISVPLVAVMTVLQEAVLAIVHQNGSHFSSLWLPAVISNSLIAWPLYSLASWAWHPRGEQHFRPGKGRAR
ncbi:MAG: rod shape-determining protein MreD [Cyanobacteria bacterium REEB65]|nr:rod shape-determining protein MreD [Cyanobacteria bacterium REEB65]